MAAFSAMSRNSKQIISTRAFSSYAVAAGAATTTTTNVSFKSAKSVILLERDPERLAKLILQNCQHPKFIRHRPLFNHSIHKLSLYNRSDLIDQILQSQLSNDDAKFLKSEGFWIRVMMIYSRAGMVDHALRTLEVCIGKRCFEPSEKTLCAILSVCLSNGLFDKVHQLFDIMPKRLSVVPGVVSNNLKLKAFVKEDKIKDAIDWISKMEKGKNKVKPNIDSYNVVLGGCLDSPNLSTFDSVLKDVLKEGNGVECNLATYNYRIVRLCKKKECARAKKLLNEMVTNGVKPNSASYNSVIDGFCRLGDFESAKEVLESMVANGHVCSFPYFSLFRSMVKEGEFDSALGVVKETLKRKWVPPFEAMEGLVNGLAKVSKADEVKDVVEKMKKMLKGNALQSWEKIEASLPL